jgi:negative regulator of flagellin synthesis FlgM
MTNGISNTGPVGPSYTKPVKALVDESKSKATSAAEGDKIDFSAEAARLIAEPGFDAAKVATIKQAITSGNYPLDSKRIAESFVALEKMIGHATPPDAASGS